MTELAARVALGQDDADALRPFEQFHHHRRPVHPLDAGRDVFGLARVDRRRQADVVPAEQLQAAQLVARSGDGLRLVEAVDAHHLELPHHRQAEEGDRRPDARNDGIDRADRFALVEQFRVASAEADVELERVQHAHLVAALLRGLDQDARAVQRFLPRQDDETHAPIPSTV